MKTIENKNIFGKVLMKFSRMCAKARSATTTKPSKTQKKKEKKEKEKNEVYDSITSTHI